MFVDKAFSDRKGIMRIRPKVTATGAAVLLSIGSQIAEAGQDRLRSAHAAPTAAGEAQLERYLFSPA